MDTAVHQTNLSPVQGSKLMKKSSHNLQQDSRKFSRNFANFSHKIAALHCVVSGLAKKYEPAILACKETAENGE